MVYRERLELERRWAGTNRMDLSASRSFGGHYDEGEDMEMKENIKPWEPAVRRMEGHADRCEVIIE